MDYNNSWQDASLARREKERKIGDDFPFRRFRKKGKLEHGGGSARVVLVFHAGSTHFLVPACLDRDRSMKLTVTARTGRIKSKVAKYRGLVG